MSEVKTWIQWRYEDHCRADDKFVKESDHLATVQALEARVAELEEELTKAYGLLKEWKSLSAEINDHRNKLLGGE